MRSTTLETLKDFFEHFPFMQGGTVDSDEIQAAEDLLRVHFVPDYYVFVENFGGALVGAYPLFGLRRADPMDDQLWSVITVTEHFRRQSWPGLDSAYVVSMDHSGNPIWVDSDGVLKSFDHDRGEPLTVAHDIESYLLACLAKEPLGSEPS